MTGNVWFVFAWPYKCEVNWQYFPCNFIGKKTNDNFAFLSQKKKIKKISTLPLTFSWTVYATCIIDRAYVSRELDAFGSWRLHRGLLKVWQLPLTYCSTYIKNYLYTWLNGSCQTISKIPLESITQTHRILVLCLNTDNIQVNFSTYKYDNIQEVT